MISPRKCSTLSTSCPCPFSWTWWSPVAGMGKGRVAEAPVYEAGMEYGGHDPFRTSHEGIGSASEFWRRSYSDGRNGFRV